MLLENLLESISYLITYKYRFMFFFSLKIFKDTYNTIMRINKIQLTLDKLKSLYSKFRVSRRIFKVPSNYHLYICILTLLRSNFDLQRLLCSRKENLVPSIKVQHIFISFSRSVKQPTDQRSACFHSGSHVT